MPDTTLWILFAVFIGAYTYFSSLLKRLKRMENTIDFLERQNTRILELVEHFNANDCFRE